MYNGLCNRCALECNGLKNRCGSGNNTESGEDTDPPKLALTPATAK